MLKTMNSKTRQNDVHTLTLFLLYKTHYMALFFICVIQLFKLFRLTNFNLLLILADVLNNLIYTMFSNTQIYPQKIFYLNIEA